MAERYKSDFLVIGGGPCGLGAALRLQRENQDWALIEAENEFGGLSASFKDDAGFTWDIGGHVLFSHYDTFDFYMREALGDEWFDHERESWVWMKDRFIPYPFQNNLHRLDPEDRWRCVKGLLDVISNPPEGRPDDFEQWMEATMGEGIAALFMKPYNFKVWAYPPREMAYNWIGERVAVPPLDKVLQAICLNEDSASWGPNNLFRFPKFGGTGAIWRALGAKLEQARCSLGCRVIEIDPAAKLVRDTNGDEWKYNHLISTIPLDNLIRMTGNIVDNTIADQLKSSATHVVGIGLKGQPPKHLDTKCWMYFPQDNSPYYRTTVFSNYSCNNVAEPGKQWSLMTEISESPAKPVDQDSLIDEVVRAFTEDKLISPDDEIVTRMACRVPYGYPTPFKGRNDLVDPALKRFEEQGIYSRGRFGAWKYEVANMDHSFAQGYECIDRLLGLAGDEIEPTLNTPAIVNSRRNG